MTSNHVSLQSSTTVSSMNLVHILVKDLERQIATVPPLYPNQNRDSRTLSQFNHHLDLTSDKNKAKARCPAPPRPSIPFTTQKPTATLSVHPPGMLSKACQLVIMSQMVHKQWEDMGSTADQPKILPLYQVETLAFCAVQITFLRLKSQTSWISFPTFSSRIS